MHSMYAGKITDIAEILVIKRNKYEHKKSIRLPVMAFIKQREIT